MNDHLREDRIQDYAEDLLCNEERAEVELHLTACAACRDDVRAARDVLDRLASLPLAVEVPRDLLAGINAQIDAGIDPHIDAAINAQVGATGAAGRAASTPGLRRLPHPLLTYRYPLAAAAVVLIAATAVVTALVTRQEGRVADRVSQAVSDVRLASTATATELRYRDAAAALERELDAQRSHLTPETIRLIEENLRVIDSALAEARTALGSDPGNPMLTDMVRSAYEKKIELLRHATTTRGDT